MARFILDVMLNDDKDLGEKISEVLDVIERDELLRKSVTSIRTIDETNDNQFFSHDFFFKENVGYIKTSPMMNKLSERQIKRDTEILLTY